MSTSGKLSNQALFVRLAIIVVVWYLGLSFLPQIVGNCLAGECDFSSGEIIFSFAIPLIFIALPVVLEMLLYRKSLSQSLSEIGITRFNGMGIRTAAIYLLPLLVFHPLFSLATNTTLVTQPNWQWLVLRVVLINGLAEEIMMRGFVFRHLRERYTFWRAAALATVYFAAYHVVLIFTAGLVVGVIAIIVAIPLGFLTAYIYEHGANTIWGSGLLHAVYNTLAMVFIFPPDIQPIAASLYLLAGIVISTIMLVWIIGGTMDRRPYHGALKPSAIKN
jgi:membrane protease YdiL (CAAX protease family)